MSSQPPLQLVKLRGKLLSNRFEREGLFFMGLGLSCELSKALFSYRDKCVVRLRHFAKLILEQLLAILPFGAFLRDPLKLPLQLANLRNKLRKLLRAIIGHLVCAS